MKYLKLSFRHVFALLIFIAVLSFAASASVQHVMSIQGKAVNRTSGALLTAGNVSVSIFDASTGGNLVFNDTFNNTISNGTFNVLIGSQMQLNLTYNKMYHMELAINREIVIGSTNRRQFFATGGPNQTYLTVNENSDGNVGIGTSSPASKLEVVGSANVLALNVNNTLYVNTTSSRVGIGTASPNNSVLDIVGSNNQIRVSYSDTIYGTIGTDYHNLWMGASDDVIDLVSGSAPDSITLRLGYSPGAGASYGRIVGNTGGGLQIDAADGASTFFNGITLSNTGRVGINITSPLTILDVRGNQDSVTRLNLLNNNDTGTSAQTEVLVGQSWSNQYGRLQYFNSNYGSSGAYMANATVIDAEGPAGLNLVAGQSTGAIRFYAGGTTDSNESMRITETRNVGIGTTSPQAPLHVNATLGANRGQLSIESPTTNTFMTWYEGSTYQGYIQYYGGDFNIQNYANGSYGDLVLNPTGGNVGIGTTSPQQKLDVNGTLIVNSSGNVGLWSNGTNVGIGTASPTYKLHIKGDTLIGGTANTNKQLVIGSYTGVADESERAYIRTLTGGILDLLSDQSNAKITFTAWDGAANTERMRIIGSTGNVGIGTTTPTRLFDYDASGYSKILYLNGSVGDVDLVIDGGTPRISMFERDGIANNRWLEFLVGGSIAKFASLTDDGNNNVATIMALNISNGNVGIGTANPASKLEVVGSANVLALNVNNTLYVNTTSSQVGIGTATPEAEIKLDIVGHTKTAGAFYSSPTGGTIGASFNNGGSNYMQIRGVSYSGSSALEIGYGTNSAGAFGTPVLQIRDTGKVGIGVTSPNSKLQVNGSILLGNANDVDFSIKPDSNIAYAGSSLYVSGGGVVGNGAGGNLYLSGGVGSSNQGQGDVYIYGGSNLTSKGDVILANDGSNSIGKVGINTTSPTQALTVVGDANVTGTLYVGAQSFANIDATGSSTIGRNLTVSNNVLFVNNLTGYVGFGTSSPNAKIESIGNVLITNALAAGTAGSATQVNTGDPNTKGLVIKGNTTSGGNATVFTDTQGSYLNATSVAGLQGGSGTTANFTLGVWVKLNSKANTMYIAGKYNNSDSAKQEYLLYYDSSADRFVIFTRDGMGGSTQNANSLGSPVIGKWYYILAWHSSDRNIHIQVNDGAEDSSFGWGSYTTATPFTVGRIIDSSSSMLNGSVAAVGFWKRQLNATERTALYNGGYALPYSSLSSDLKTSLTSYWELDETSGIRSDSHSTNHFTNYNVTSERGPFAVSQSSNLQEWQNSTGGPVSVIDANGNLGLGTAAPYRRLQVNGTFEANDSAYLAVSGGKIGIGNTAPASTLDVTGSANVLALNVNNTLYVNTTTSRVGIGTTAPGYLLDVNGAGKFNGTVWFVQDTTSYGYINSVSTAMRIYADNNADMSFLLWDGSAYTERMTIKKATGNVGIGTTSPSANLHVNGSIQVDNSTTGNGFFYVNSTSGNVGIGTNSKDGTLTVKSPGAAKVSLRSGAASSNADIFADSSNDGLTFWHITNTTSGGGKSFFFNDNTGRMKHASSSASFMYLQHNVNQTGTGAFNTFVINTVENSTGSGLRYIQRWQINGSDVAVMDDFGNLGIGTSRPYAKLQINGTGTVLQTNDTTLLATDGGNVGIGTTSPNSWLNISNVAGTNLQINDSSVNTRLIINSQTHSELHLIEGEAAVEDRAWRIHVDGTKLLFDQPSDNYSTKVDLIAIDSQGNVGIGTTSPNATLDVRGDGSHVTIGNAGGYKGVGAFSGLEVQASSDRAGFNLYKTNGATDTKTWEMSTDGGLLYFRTVNDAANDANIWMQVNRSGTTINSVSLPSGNVGIGTTSPQADLALFADVELIDAFDSNNRGIGIYSVNNVGRLYIQGKTQADIILVDNGTTTNNKTIQLYADGGITAFRSLNDAGTINKDNILVLNHSSGNVGIGTTSPGNYKLNVAGTVNASAYVTNGTDYAEMMEKLYADEKIEAGDVVGIVNGKATKKAENADSFMVVSENPGVTAGEGKNKVPVAFIGQVRVKVTGKVSRGDYIIPAGNGYGISKKPEEISGFAEYKKVIGTAWESRSCMTTEGRLSDCEGIGKVLVAVGVK